MVKFDFALALHIVDSGDRTVLNLKCIFEEYKQYKIIKLLIFFLEKPWWFMFKKLKSLNDGQFF